MQPKKSAQVEQDQHLQIGGTTLMRAVLQRVNRAAVEVEGNTVGQIEKGWLVLLGVAGTDTPKDIDYLVDKTLNLRMFNDAAGKFNRSVLETKGQILVVSQFTLFGDCRKGRRPSFSKAAELKKGEEYYLGYLEKLQQSGLRIASGQYQAKMKVSLENDGPVTVLLDSSKEF